MIVFGVVTTKVVFLSLLGFGFILISAAFIALKISRRNKRQRSIKSEWKNLLGLCRDPANWPQVVIVADNLLGAALKNKKFKGRNIGERLVKAQRILTVNDEVWRAHKLRKTLEENPKKNVEKEELRETLLIFHQALKDLEAL